MPDDKPKRERIWTQERISKVSVAYMAAVYRGGDSKAALQGAFNIAHEFATVEQLKAKLIELDLAPKPEAGPAAQDESEVETFVAYLTDLAAFDAAAGTMLARKARASLAELLKAIKEGTLAKPADEVKDPDHDPDNAHVDLGIGEPPLVSA